LKKSNYSKQDAFLALLEFRNSPISGMEQSPAELLMSRKLRAKLPIPKHLLKPKSQPVNDVRQRLRVRQLRQKAAYDQGTKQLSSLQPKKSLRMRQGGVWSPAVVVEQHKSPRSYIVATSNGTQLRRNRHHLMPTNEPPMIITPPMEPVGEEERCPVIAPSTERSPVRSPVISPSTEIEEEHVRPPLRRSTRVRRAPSRLIENI
jgi:hypothetical protein